MKKPKELKIKKCPFGCDEDVKLVKENQKFIFKARELFGPRKGCMWYMPDYSQIEVWDFAFLSREKVMMNALLSGYDFHGAVARQCWGRKKTMKNEKIITELEQSILYSLVYMVEELNLSREY